MNKAVDYLGRYASSSHKLDAVLGRFAQRKLADCDADEVAAAIARTVARCAALGYIDDTAFAAGQARNHRRLGRSARNIQQRLRQHRLDEAVIDAALDTADENSGHGELHAAFLFARRRRIGPFSAKPDSADAAQRQRVLGTMARAGFAMSICLRVIDAETDAAIAMIDALEQGDDPFA
jgi:regulatory protein